MKVLMVCLGNICRSPVAEGVLRHKISENGLDVVVDSCGTSDYHEGQAPDSRSMENALDNNIDISDLRSRPFSAQDFYDFDLIYCMDKSNYNNVKNLCPQPELMDKVDLLLNLVNPNGNQDVPDPYFGGDEGFQKVFDLIDNACDVLVEKLGA